MSGVIATASNSHVESQASEIVTALGGRWRSQGAMCRCPAHDDDSPSLSVRLGNSTVLFHCFAGCDSVDVIRAIRDQGVLRRGYVHSRRSEEPNTRRAEWLAAKAKEIWDAARLLKGSPGERYFQERGLRGPYHDLRYLARTPFGPKGEVTFRPAVIAAVRDDTGLVAIQRTFLDLKTFGKAQDLDKAKMALALLGRGAVRLEIPDEVLGLAEGIENAKAARELLGIPTWATIGSERFPLVSIPSTVRRLILLPDPDQAGARGEQLAQEAHARPGLTIETRWPTRGDWNDQLLHEYARRA